LQLVLERLAGKRGRGAHGEAADEMDDAVEFGHSGNDRSDLIFGEKIDHGELHAGGVRERLANPRLVARGNQRDDEVGTQRAQMAANREPEPAGAARDQDLTTLHGAKSAMSARPPEDDGRVDIELARPGPAGCPAVI
jgi:hypothetical protein